MLMERLKAGASFQDLAAGYSEDPESAPRGGDLGLIPVSSLKQAPPALRDAILNKAPGAVNVASAGGGYSLVLVVAHEQAGQRDLSTPGMRDQHHGDDSRSQRAAAPDGVPHVDSWRRASGELPGAPARRGQSHHASHPARGPVGAVGFSDRVRRLPDVSVAPAPAPAIVPGSPPPGRGRRDSPSARGERLRRPASAGCTRGDRCREPRHRQHRAHCQKLSCGTWRDHRMVPFIFPSMGSHGAATPEGQAQVLAHFGITQESVGCPIISRLEVVTSWKDRRGH